MKKSFILFSLLLLLSAAGVAQTSATYNSNEVKEGQKAPQTELINGYPATDYYYTQITVPASILNSTALQDKINVAFHNRICNWEKSNKRPLKSLAKNDMEAVMAQLHAEAEKEVNEAPPPSAPQK